MQGLIEKGHTDNPEPLSKLFLKDRALLKPKKIAVVDDRRQEPGWPVRSIDQANEISGKAVALNTGKCRPHRSIQIEMGIGLAETAERCELLCHILGWNTACMKEQKNLTAKPDLGNACHFVLFWLCDRVRIVSLLHQPRRPMGSVARSSPLVVCPWTILSISPSFPPRSAISPDRHLRLICKRRRLR